ncbi:hypothetical protein BC628DRAFT_291142 [Trametes gibbosa]|nr:hypothetical protein BC628DRAFT_291142 [Trametes gibbosa]
MRTLPSSFPSSTGAYSFGLLDPLIHIISGPPHSHLHPRKPPAADVPSSIRPALAFWPLPAALGSAHTLPRFLLSHPPPHPRRHRRPRPRLRLHRRRPHTAPAASPSPSPPLSPSVFIVHYNSPLFSPTRARPSGRGRRASHSPDRISRPPPFCAPVRALRACGRSLSLIIPRLHFKCICTTARSA